MAFSGQVAGSVPERARARWRPDVWSLDPRRNYGVGFALVVAAYYAAAQVGYAFKFAGPVAAIVWLPVGVGMASLYLLGLRLLPAVVIGDLLVNNYSALPLGAAIGQSFGNLLEVVIGVALLRRLVSRDAPLETASSVAGVFAAIAAGTLVSAIIGPLSLLLFNATPAHSLPTVARTWWLGDFCGAAIVLPLALAFGCPGSHLRVRGRVVEALLLLVALVGVSAVASQVGGASSYLAFPLLMWAAFRFGPRGATIAIAISAAFTIWGVTHSLGPFSVGTTSDDLPATQIYLAVATLAALAVAALASERQRLAESVEASRTRIVLAADDERRRLERDLHDGAQGRLVALAARLAAGSREAVRAPETGARSLQEGHDELLVALDELRGLVHGIHPAALRQFGLARAVEDIAATSMVPIELVQLPRVRLDETAEATAFYVIREAVTNAQRHSHASLIRISAHPNGATLIVEVEDDGVGGAVERTDRGLQGLRDRVEATGGRFDVRSSAGEGTRVTAEIAPTALT